MSNRVISIDIGQFTTRICEVDLNRKNPHVYKCISFATPENAYEDGYIRDKLSFTAVAKDKIAQAGMKSRKAVFTVSSSKIANREVIIPFVKENRIQDIINANASEYFPVDVSEYAVTYSILQKIDTAGDRKIRLLVVAAPENLIKNYYNVAEMMGLDIAAMDYFGNSIYQLIRRQVNSGTNLVIQIEEQSTLINILEEDVLELQRSLPYGTTSVINAVTGNPYFKASDKAQALQLLCSRELIRLQADSFESEAAASLTAVFDNSERDSIGEETAALEDVMDSLRYLINNILRVLDYYYTKNRDKKINGIYITGQGAKFLGIGRLLQNETGIEVKRLESLQSVVFSKNIELSGEYQSDYLSCIGAAMSPIRFEPKEYLLKEKKKSNIQSVVIIFSAAVVLSAALVATSLLSYKTADLEHSDLVRRVDALENVNEVYDGHALALKAYEAVEDIYALTVSPNEKLNDLIAELERKLPSNVIVVTLNVTSTDITLGIKCDSKVTAAKVLEQLRTFPGLSQVETGGITENADEFGVRTVQFVVTGIYSPEMSLLPEEQPQDGEQPQEEQNEEQ